VVEAVLAVVAALLIGVGALFRNNYRGIAGRFAGWAAQSNSGLTQRRGPHRWFDIRFQTRVYRVYGWTVLVIGFILLNAAFHV
jgi:hypothetical protein